MMFPMGNCVKTNKQDVVNSQKPRGATVRDSSYNRQMRGRGDIDDERELERESREQERKKTDAKKPANKEIVICVIGLDEAGKSTVTKALKGDKDLKDTTPTVGYEPHEFKYGSSNLKIYDLGGGSRFRDVWKHYLAESYGYIYVIDSSNRTRINECRSVFASFLENEKVAGKPILILANKQDQPNALDEGEIVQYLNVEELVNKFQVPCRIETCIAFQGVANKIDPSLKLGFDWLIKHIQVHMDELRTRIDYDTEVQRNREMRLKKEKFERVKQKRELENPDYYKSTYDNEDYSGSNPWKPLNDLNSKDTKPKTSSAYSGYGEPPISAQDRQLLDEMRVSSPRLRLTTINEEKMKSKNSSSNNRFMKSNKLSPYDDGSDYESYAKSKSTPSWAVSDPLKRNPSARSRFES